MEILNFLMGHFRAGGWGMWPILVTGIFAISIIIERVWFVFIKSNVSAERFTREVLNLIKQGRIEQAKALSNRSDAALYRITRAALFSAGGSMRDVQDAVDESSLSELPRLDKRTPYLAMLGNVAVLLGLFGTITGLIKTFAALGGASAAEKATMLSEGISEAMNCTAFGLIVAIPSLIVYGVLQGRVTRINNDIDASMVPIINALAEYEGKV
jgi:biopolymer transport protein ExbB/TolQ